MRRIIFALIAIIVITCLITLLFTYNQVTNESNRLENDIQYRSLLLADGLKSSIEPDYTKKSNQQIQTLVKKFTDNQRIAGMAIINNKGEFIAISANLPTKTAQLQKVGINAMDGDKANGIFLQLNNSKFYVFAEPLHNEKNIVTGVLIIMQQADYINARLIDIWENNLLRFIVQSFFISIAVLLIIKWIILEPIRNIATSIQSTSNGNSTNIVKKMMSNSLFEPLMREIRTMQQNLVTARISASEEARLRLKKIDSPWTAERLNVFVQSIMKEKKIFVISNREPYTHTKNGNKITYHIPASGMVTAIEPIMHACGGMWIGLGNGNADKLVVDVNDKVAVPPNDPKYTLKRVWLSEEEQKGYYDGFSNEGLWPLCHIAHTRPIFRKNNWEQYIKVNEKFAKTALKEIRKQSNPIILIQDFHFALLPRMIKDKRPDAIISLFWHIPWPNAESFSICPWKKEILNGILGADVLGFHTQLHCNNFINTIGKELEALIDLEQFSITKNNHTTFVKPFPISIALTSRKEDRTVNIKQQGKDALKALDIQTPYVGIGVDRLDYTKGVIERLKAIELFLTNYPTFLEKFTFVQISAPSRTTIKQYQDFEKHVEEEITRINNRFKKNTWKPIVFLKRYHSHEEIYPLYRIANFCLVTSLHDGMNLVAKEFVSARDDEKGVLILSQFAGASRELRDALIINPYNGEQTATAIYTALRMKKSEQTKRMRRMREIIKGYNIYRWSAELLRTMVDLG
jgi:trehalose 6-phosphate synthase